MSHAATNWAIQHRGLKPAAKIVLWHLADCHNGHTGQCNPRQAILADRCEMSRSTVNVHLAELARRGLIRRVTEVDPTTKRQRPTLYILAMDDPRKSVKAESGNRTRAQDVDGATQHVAEPCPETGHGAVSGNGADPSPDSGQSRVRNPDSIENPGIEPGIGGDGCARESARVPVSVDASEDGGAGLGADDVRGKPATSFREQALVAMGHDPTGITATGRLVGGSSDMIELKRWRTDLGLSDAEIIGVIREVAMAKRDGPPNTWRYFSGAMQRLAAEKVRPDLKPAKNPPATGGFQHAKAASNRDRLDAFIAGARGAP